MPDPAARRPDAREPERPPYRLPRTAIPRRYALTLHPDLATGRFDGRAEIRLDVREAVEELVLNAVDLTLDDVALTGAEGRLTATPGDRPELEQVVLSLSGRAEPGAWTLSLRFAGTMAEGLRGLYRKTVAGPDGEPVVVASTQCEPTDARRIFPCWDEPDMKAVFAVTLVVDPGLTALSNGPETASHTGAAGLRRVSFADTMPMSTYLFAIAVGPFEFTAPVRVGSTPVRVAARRGLIQLADVALAEAVACLRFFEDYFGLPCPADKMDHVGIPDFAAGAMENPGLVTYREEALLVDSERGSPMERLGVSSTIAHETAHMWFGDLVTMRWWNGIWLNEAFATFMQQLATDAVHPEWQVWATLYASRAHALSVDGLATTRPIEFPVGPPAEAEAMFDILTYAKGGAVLRMLEQYLGAETFRDGVRVYLGRHRHANAETTDLWDALESASGEPVRAVMDSWVFQGGYPLVRAEAAQGGREVRLSQQPFRYSGSGEGVWQIPLAVALGRADGGRDVVRLLLGADGATVPLPTDVRWVLVNHEGQGFYRSAYDEALWECIVGAWPALSAVERLGLLDDVWATVLAGRAEVGQAVHLWQHLAGEHDPNVWAAVESQMRLLDRMSDEGGRRALERVALELGRPLLAELGWEPPADESFEHGRLRALVVRLLGTVGRDPEVRREATARLRAHLAGGPPVAPSLLNQVTGVVADAGGEAEWELIYRAFRAAATPQDETRYLTALAAFRDVAIVRRALDLYLSPEVRVQDTPIGIATALMNRHSQAEAWETIERHWDDLLGRFHPTVVQQLVGPLPWVLDEALAARAARWLTAHPVPAAAPQVAQALDFQAVHLALARRVAGRVARLLGEG